MRDSMSNLNTDFQAAQPKVTDTSSSKPSSLKQGTLGNHTVKSIDAKQAQSTLKKGAHMAFSIAMTPVAIVAGALSGVAQGALVVLGSALGFLTSPFSIKGEQASKPVYSAAAELIRKTDNASPLRNHVFFKMTRDIVLVLPRAVAMVALAFKIFGSLSAAIQAKLKGETTQSQYTLAGMQSRLALVGFFTAILKPFVALVPKSKVSETSSGKNLSSDLSTKLFLFVAQGTSKLRNSSRSKGATNDSDTAASGFFNQSLGMASLVKEYIVAERERAASSRSLNQEKSTHSLNASGSPSNRGISKSFPTDKATERSVKQSRSAPPSPAPSSSSPGASRDTPGRLVNENLLKKNETISPLHNHDLGPSSDLLD